MMRDFTYVRPTSVAEASEILRSNEEARLLAGGMSLLPIMKQRLAAPSHLVDIGPIPELTGVEMCGDEVRVGAMTTHETVAESSIVKQVFPALASLAGGIGDRQVRHRGTIGGSTANADPVACYPAALIATSAHIHTNRRVLSADEFFLGVYETALARDEIITAIYLPRPRRAGYAKFPHPASRFAVVGVFVADFGNGDVRVAVTGARSAVYREPLLEDAFRSKFCVEAARTVLIPHDGLNEDLFAPADYRANLISVMASRAIAMAIERA